MTAAVLGRGTSQTDEQPGGKRMRALTYVLATALLVAAPALAQHSKHGDGKAGHHHRFDDPQKWSKSFDDPERDAWQKPGDVIRTLALKPDARVADIGAGTGYFTIRLAKAVPAGKVFAVDIEAKMVEHLAKRAKDAGLGNVEAVKGTETSARLPEPVDLALLVNSFHHIDARVAYIKGLATSLRPGGRVAIIEYRPDAERGAPKHMRLSPAQVDADMKAAGFARMSSHDLLPHQNFLVYQRSVK